MRSSSATVVFAKLDRLTRNVDLLRSLVASGVDLVFCDLPDVPPGAMGRFLLTQMASVAELEAGLIQRAHQGRPGRRKGEGSAARQPERGAALRGKQIGNDAAVARIRARARERADNLRAIVEDIRQPLFVRWPRR